jgi:hypothetical protein
VRYINLPPEPDQLVPTPLAQVVHEVALQQQRETTMFCFPKKQLQLFSTQKKLKNEKKRKKIFETYDFFFDFMTLSYRKKHKKKLKKRKEPKKKDEIVTHLSPVHVYISA